jgi:hypothetical protein
MPTHQFSESSSIPMLAKFNQFLVGYGSVNRRLLHPELLLRINGL